MNWIKANKALILKVLAAILVAIGGTQGGAVAMNAAPNEPYTQTMTWVPLVLGIISAIAGVWVQEPSRSKIMTLLDQISKFFETNTDPKMQAAYQQFLTNQQNVVSKRTPEMLATAATAKPKKKKLVEVDDDEDDDA